MIVEICRLVEGMPLAIELAASWVTLMSAADILAAIRESLRFLETDLRGVPERHRSMEAVFDATWQRIERAEQRIFAQLSVFRGGFTQEAVRHITGAELGQLRTLAASSLIVYDHERNRYTVHELLRQYGALRLAERPDLAQNANQAHSHLLFRPAATATECTQEPRPADGSAGPRRRERQPEPGMGLGDRAGPGGRHHRDAGRAGTLPPVSWPIRRRRGGLSIGGGGA